MTRQPQGISQLKFALQFVLRDNSVNLHECSLFRVGSFMNIYIYIVKNFHSLFDKKIYTFQLAKH